MIESIKHLVREAMENPVTTAVVGTTTTAAGFFNKFFSDLPYIHELLSDLSMLCGTIACLALARLHYIKGNAEQLKNEELIKSLKDKDGSNK